MATSYSGTLVYTNDTSYGLTALAQNASTGWRNYSILSWEVSHDPDAGPEGFDWFYSYTIEAEKFAPVRWVIETGPDFTTDHIDFATVQVYVDGSQETYDATNKIVIGLIETTGEDPDRRSMPEDRYGLFFTDTGTGGQNTDRTTITFWSSFEPMWGDLYSNCGGNGNRGWNNGFETDNPTDPASSGSLDHHVLVPGVIPEPATALLGALPAFLWWIKRRRFDRRA